MDTLILSYILVFSSQEVKKFPLSFKSIFKLYRFHQKSFFKETLWQIMSQDKCHAVLRRIEHVNFYYFFYFFWGGGIFPKILNHIKFTCNIVLARYPGGMKFFVIRSSTSKMKPTSTDPESGGSYNKSIKYRCIPKQATTWIPLWPLVDRYPSASKFFSALL